MTNGWNPRTGEEWFRWMEKRVREQERSAGQRPEWADGSSDPDVVDASIWPGVMDPDTVSAPALADVVVENPEQPVITDPPPDETEVGGFPGDAYNEFDEQGPRAPSKPITISRLGAHEVTWDGLAEGDEVMDDDFSYLVVHRSEEAADFVPTDDTRFDVLRAPGSVTVTGAAYGSTWYYRFVAHDASNNASEPSYPSDPVVTVGLVSTDIIGQVIDGANIVDGTLVASDKIVANSVTSAELAALSVIAGKIAANAVTADTIAVGAVAASKISTGELAASVRIIAGPTLGTHAEMSDTGFRAYVEDPLDGVPNEAVRMGTDTGDLFAVFDSTGTVKASIADTGLASFSGLNVDADPVIVGQPFIGKLGNTLPDLVDFANDPVNYARDYEVDPIGIIEQYAKGTVAWCQFAPASLTATSTGGVNCGLFELGFDLEPGRQYEFDTSNMLLNLSGAGTIGLILRYTVDGSIPNLSSSIAAYDYKRTDAAGLVSCGLHSRLVNGGATSQTQVRFLVCLYGSGGTASVASGALINAQIKDLGPIKTATGTVRNLTSGTPATQSVRTYTKTYTSTSSGTYKGTGVKRTDTPDVVQGYNSANGDGEGLWIFPSMTADLAGTTVTKVEVYAYANHWYYNSGGTALVKVHGYTSAPASSPSQTTAKTVTEWPKPGGKWVLLPSSFYAGFKSGTYRGFGMGPSGGTNLLYYGRFNGGTGAKIRVTYTK